jgi:hypothetical protein
MGQEIRTAVQMPPGAGVRIRRAFATSALAATLLAVAVPGASAAKPPAPPHAGPWKIMLAINTPHGQTVTNKVIGGFKVTRHQKISGFHLTFTEGGETTGCAGGSPEGPKSGTISIPSSPPLPINKLGRTWQVATSTGSLGGDSVQPEEVVVLTAFGSRSPNSRLSMTLVTHKGPRSGYVSWNQQQCGIAFVVAPG